MSKWLLDCNGGFFIADTNEIFYADSRGGTICINLSSFYNKKIIDTDFW